MGLRNYFLSDSPNVLIGEGWVYHGRPVDSQSNKPRMKNAFKYSTFNVLIPLHRPNSIKELNKFPYLSIHPKDYLESKDGDLFENAKEFLQKHLNYAPEKIWLQSLPKIFGYSFNPISFWYCYSKEKLDGILCEVNNTFGDRHFYFIRCAEGIDRKTFTLSKKFHVSPFFPVSGSYTFEFDTSFPLADVKIKLWDQEKLKLDTRLYLSLDLLSKKTTWQILKTYKWLTVAVIVHIHAQALKLWFKGAKFYSRPQPPQEKFTL